MDHDVVVSVGAHSDRLDPDRTDSVYGPNAAIMFMTNCESVLEGGSAAANCSMTRSMRRSAANCVDSWLSSLAAAAIALWAISEIARHRAEYFALRRRRRSERG